MFFPQVTYPFPATVPPPWTKHALSGTGTRLQVSRAPLLCPWAVLEPSAAGALRGPTGSAFNYLHLSRTSPHPLFLSPITPKGASLPTVHRELPTRAASLSPNLIRNALRRQQLCAACILISHRACQNAFWDCLCCKGYAVHY